MTFVPHIRVLGCLVVALLLLGCTSASKKKRIAFVANHPSQFWTLARRGCEKAGQELKDVEIEFRIPGVGTAAEQKQIIDDLLDKGIQGIAICPVDPANQTQMLNDAARQALLLTQDSDAPQSDRACYLGADNHTAGRQAGELIKEALPGGGKIMIFVGRIDSQNAKDRYEGIRESLRGSNVQILDVRTDGTDLVKAKANVADTLVKYPDIAACVGLWSYNGPTILSAVTDAGKVGQVKIICFNEDEKTLAGIKNGAIYATIVQQPFEIGYQSIQMMAKALRGDKSVLPASKQVFIPTVVVRKNDVEAYMARTN